MKKNSLIAATFLILSMRSFSQDVKPIYVNSFDNVNHPQVAYWFFAANMLPEERYKAKIDSFVKYSKYTLVFLTERNGVSFSDITLMHPILQKLVAYAHTKGLKIGLQIWKNNKGVTEENTDRLIQEGETVLDKNGNASYHVHSRGARDTNSITKSELFKIYAFKKTGDGFYDASTLQDITGKATSQTSMHDVQVSVKAGSSLAGYTAYILTQHYTNSCSNFSEQAYALTIGLFKAYSDIPFDGVGLDEYKNFTISRQPILEGAHETFRERVYSLGMAKKMKELTGLDLDRTFFDMRYAPNGNAAVRMRAINEYMHLFRTATLGVEAAMYDYGKKNYGKDAFIGLHSTFHNNLDRDEVWQTGVSWWNIKRDYGHTDEETPTPIQIGIGMSYKKNAMYNMYYGKDLTRIWTKALYDLRYGIRTHYHAANDVQGWGVSIDDPLALAKINKVENAARLLNRFNPPFPQIKLLVVYGMEALYNWYPNTNQRGMYDVNDKLGMEPKSVSLWQNGYLNAAVPTDEIEDGRLKLNAQGKPELNGYTFDAVVFLNPQYSKAVTTKFFQSYVNKGGKLLIEGPATNDFYGKDMSAAWKEISTKATANSFSLDNVAKLGVPKVELKDGVPNEPGSFTFTNSESLESNTPATFRFTYKNDVYSGSYKGLAAIKLDAKGNLQKLAATAFSSLQKNGKDLLRLSSEADIFLQSVNGVIKATLADPTKSISIKK
jgi:hypothetical protein